MRYPTAQSNKPRSVQAVISDCFGKCGARGGIEFPDIWLKSGHFLNDDFLVYPSMYPAFRTTWQRQKPFVLRSMRSFQWLSDPASARIVPNVEIEVTGTSMPA